ncbi:hypothetical protein MicloDRAFT_00001850 [Microvirga lotononidis]|uniref:Uncharacterized protein n=1 Tax=Microvirga lotononidis TaxID=864069 RepID=I4Z4Q3_9HYPH|nr:hypothetical protein MicloDRAFT_00001850 [Microvirga lotononidis]
MWQMYGQKVVSVLAPTPRLFYVKGKIPYSTGFQQGLSGQRRQTEDGDWEATPWIKDVRWIATICSTEKRLLRMTNLPEPSRKFADQTNRAAGPLRPCHLSYIANSMSCDKPT